MEGRSVDDTLESIFEGWYRREGEEEEIADSIEDMIADMLRGGSHDREVKLQGSLELVDG